MTRAKQESSDVPCARSSVQRDVAEQQRDEAVPMFLRALKEIAGAPTGEERDGLLRDLIGAIEAALGKDVEAVTSEKLDYDRNTRTQNRRGEWVPSIPLPFFGLRKRCHCGAQFWTLKGYRGHYAYEHVLGGE